VSRSYGSNAGQCFGIGRLVVEIRRLLYFMEQSHGQFWVALRADRLNGSGSFLRFSRWLICEFGRLRLSSYAYTILWSKLTLIWGTRDTCLLTNDVDD